MLRPALAVLLAAGCVLATQASAAPAREQAREYALGAGPSVTVAGQAVRLPTVTVLNRRTGALRFPTQPRERTVTLRVADLAGAGVGGRVAQVVDGRQVLLGDFCGASGALRLARPGAEVLVLPVQCAAGPPTTGTVTARFR